MMQSLEGRSKLVNVSKWEGLKAGGEEDGRGRDDWIASLISRDMSLNRLWELVMDRKA